MDSAPDYNWYARLVSLTEALEQGEQPVDVNLEPDGNNQAGHVPRQPAEPAPETAGADAANTTREAAMSPAPEELITPLIPQEILTQLAQLVEQSASIHRQLEELLAPSLSARRRVIPTPRPRGTGDVVQPSRWPAGNINRVMSARRPVIPTQGPRGTGYVVQPSRWPAGTRRIMIREVSRFEQPRVSLYPRPEPGQDTRDIVRDLPASVRPDMIQLAKQGRI